MPTQTYNPVLQIIPKLLPEAWSFFLKNWRLIYPFFFKVLVIQSVFHVVFKNMASVLEMMTLSGPSLWWLDALFNGLSWIMYGLQSLVVMPMLLVVVWLGLFVIQARGNSEQAAQSSPSLLVKDLILEVFKNHRQALVVTVLGSIILIVPTSVAVVGFMYVMSMLYPFLLTLPIWALVILIPLFLGVSALLMIFLSQFGMFFTAWALCRPQDTVGEILGSVFRRQLSELVPFTLALLLISLIGLSGIIVVVGIFVTAPLAVIMLFLLFQHAFTEV